MKGTTVSITSTMARLLTLAAAAATAAALSTGTASAAPAVDAPSTSTLTAPTVAVDMCNNANPCLRLSRAETKQVADAPLSNVPGIVAPFCPFLPAPASVACGAGLPLRALDYKYTASRAVQAGRCMVISFAPDPTWVTVGSAWQGDCRA